MNPGSMNKLFVFLFIIVSNLILAQNIDDKTFLVIDGQEFDAGTFKRLYLKNIDIVQDESQKDIDNYLELYIDYRLKLMQAYELGLDKEPEYLNEIKKQRSSLAKNYLTDNEVTDALVQEAYNRSIEEVNASHIIVKLDKGSSPQDTLKAYNRIYQLYQRAQKEDFAKLARETSEGPSAGNGGELGWFGGFRMTYDFESVAFKTPVGSISKPFRTEFGYHILKVNDRRPNRGEVTVAHIMTFDKPNATTQDAATRIQDIYEQLESGKNFGELAREFSDDLNSATKGGELTRFGTGGLNSVIFVDKALSIEKEGSYTKPFETKFGWHIVKLLEKHDLPKFDEIKKTLENKIKRSPRSRKITKSFVNKLKSSYQVPQKLKVPDYILKEFNDSILTGQWLQNVEDRERKVLTINDTDIMSFDFFNFVENQQMKNPQFYKTVNEQVQFYFDLFVDDQVMNYYDKHLERDNKDFAFVYNEFKEANLLFNLMQKKIWNKAKEDSIGQRDYYNKHKEKYEWKRRLDIILTQNTSKEVATEVQQMLKDQIPVDEIKESLNENGRVKVIVSTGVVEESFNRLPDNFEVKEGVSTIYHNEGDSFYKVVYVKSIKPSAPKTFEEAVGNVINDYQQQLEKEWLSSLRKDRKIKVKKNIFKKIKKQLAAYSE